ncbi:hypothetical protein [Rhodobacter capsulatus]|uniref:hypothetical protein n=1 Tax=Rhodobacter capsulatus TaxID=1061 RepID=UPI0003D3323F|nr:hypothetical protein [Rhodobacter capsulatus]ETD90521.1 hypothetical protein U713_05270 [Rhodobacter capsulatus YW2]
MLTRISIICAGLSYLAEVHVIAGDLTDPCPEGRVSSRSRLCAVSIPDVAFVKGNIMLKPEWTLPGAVGAFAGVLLTTVTGFVWAEWEIRSGVRHAAEAEVVRALVPLCVDRARTDPEREAKLVALRQGAPLAQLEIMFETGWLPGALAEGFDRAVATGCIAALRNRGA